MSSGVDSPSQSTSSALNGAQSDSPLTAAPKVTQFFLSFSVPANDRQLSYTQSLRRAIVKKFNTLRGHSAPSPLEEGSVEAPAKAAHATVPKKLKKGASPPSVINVFRQSVVCELCTNISASGVKDIYCSDKCAKRGTFSSFFLLCLRASYARSRSASPRDAHARHHRLQRRRPHQGTRASPRIPPRRRANFSLFHRPRTLNSARCTAACAGAALARSRIS